MGNPGFHRWISSGAPPDGPAQQENGCISTALFATKNAVEKQPFSGCDNIVIREKETQLSKNETVREDVRLHSCSGLGRGCV